MKMGPLGRPALPELIPLLKLPQNTNWSERGNALQALGALGPDPRSIRALSEQIEDPDYHWKLEAARNLWKLTHDANLIVPLLIGNIRHPEGFYYWLPIEILGEIGPEAKDAVPELQKALNSP